MLREVKMDKDEKLKKFLSENTDFKFKKIEFKKIREKSYQYFILTCKNLHETQIRSDQLCGKKECSTCKKAMKSFERFERFKKIIEMKNGLIVDSIKPENFNYDSKVIIRCKDLHEWRTTLAVQSKSANHWCPFCANKASHTISDVQKAAEKHGGICLSKIYRGKHEKYEFKCDRGHKWRATYNSVDRGTWCPDCSVGKIESLVREYLASTLDLKLVKCRPDWLHTEDGKKLELDGFDEQKKIAFEYQGEHHSCDEFRYKGTKKISREEVVRRDKFKADRCQEIGVKLIVIDLIEDKINPDDEIKNKIINECRRLDIKIINPIESLYIDRKSLSRLRENEMQELALKRRGKFLDEYYISSLHKHNWECELGHQFLATPGNVSQGKWCPKCKSIKIAEFNRIGIDEFKNIAQQKGGRCLSTKYLRSRAKLKFICKNKHEFEKTGEQVRKKDEWCPDCEKK